MPRWLKPLVFLLCLLPLVMMLVFGPQGRVVADPAGFIIHQTGEWALKFLILTLAVTPLRKIFHWSWLPPLRRMLGLYAFFYAVVHLSIYLAADLGFSLTALWTETVKHPYILAGMVSALIMLPLAITSTDRMIKRLGGVNWRRLHQLAYLAALSGVLHFYLMKVSKNHTEEPLMYTGVLLLLLAYRVADHFGVAPKLSRKRRERTA